MILQDGGHLGNISLSGAAAVLIAREFLAWLRERKQNGDMPAEWRLTISDLLEKANAPVVHALENLRDDLRGHR